MERLSKLDIKFLTGVGPKRGELLAKELGIRSFYDLLYYFPFRYVDRSTIYKISDINGEMPYIQIKGRLVNMNVVGEGAKRRVNALFSDGTGLIELVWFNRVKYITENYRPGVEYIVFGKPTKYNNKFNIAHPEMEVYKADRVVTGLRGVYNLTEVLRNRSITSRTIQQLVQNMFSNIKGIDETLPMEVVKRHNLISIYEALVNIHSPESIEMLQRAQLRLKFEELFYIQMNILRYAKGRDRAIRGLVFGTVGRSFNDFYNNVLPFPLTNAQKRVIKEIRKDMGSGKQMNRLLQGDVGSGKTLVALMTMLIAIDNNYQAAIMAPTEILANQHYETIKEWCEKIGLKVALLTGSTRKREREVIHHGLISGELNILIGTHALLEDNVQFSNLGLVVIDEQHRFGVAQRARLWKKNSTYPHILVMTATPIPRTLAMTVYGDLDVSVIDELPPGRKPIQTLLRYDTHRTQVEHFIGSQLRVGRQVYIVYPLIYENEKLNLNNLEEGYEHICEIFPSYQVAMVHGKLKAAEKDYQMQRFVTGEANIMVATTVIEVGVNVPNATTMIIENAERFGLSQLHQLRGRVGRGGEQSYCVLMSHHKIAKETRQRLEIMTSTNDGFLISEADLKMRGPGDLEGTQQSGIPFNLRISNLAKDGEIIQMARVMADDILTADPELTSAKNVVLNRMLELLFSNTAQWRLIS
ncbi:MAG: ATP-dependent DNA helicase RecG [Bacteroidales bacterium]